jgi:hypothetical protein
MKLSPDQKAGLLITAIVHLAVIIVLLLGGIGFEIIKSIVVNDAELIARRILLGTAIRGHQGIATVAQGQTTAGFNNHGLARLARTAQQGAEVVL